MELLDRSNGRIKFRTEGSASEGEVWVVAKVVRSQA
tara:strand:- start:387 stop:494 length:108 start_codon:yes stop_codon:yes gene_type:complete